MLLFQHNVRTYFLRRAVIRHNAVSYIFTVRNRNKGGIWNGDLVIVTTYQSCGVFGSCYLPNGVGIFFPDQSTGRRRSQNRIIYTTFDDFSVCDCQIVHGFLEQNHASSSRYTAWCRNTVCGNQTLEQSNLFICVILNECVFRYRNACHNFRVFYGTIQIQAVIRYLSVSVIRQRGNVNITFGVLHDGSTHSEQNLVKVFSTGSNRKPTIYGR